MEYNKLVEFFRTLQIKHRINNVYNHYVDNIDTTLSKINPANPKLFIDPFRKIIYHLSNFKITQPILAILKFIRKSHNIFYINPLCLDKVISIWQYIK